MLMGPFSHNLIHLRRSFGKAIRKWLVTRIGPKLLGSSVVFSGVFIFPSIQTREVALIGEGWEERVKIGSATDFYAREIMFFFIFLPT